MLTIEDKKIIDDALENYYNIFYYEDKDDPMLAKITGIAEKIKKDETIMEIIEEQTNLLTRGRYGLQAIYEDYSEDTECPECVREVRDYYKKQVEYDLTIIWKIKGLLNEYKSI